jgi:hypothetical protein
MPDSKRESIMKRFATVLAPAYGIGGRIYRSRAEAVDLQDHPCVLLSWSSEQPTPETLPQTERTLTVNVEILVRNDEPDAVADQIAQSVHSLIMADTQLNGLAIDTMLGDARFDYDSADQTAAKLTHEYLVKFRHGWSDMTA